MAIYTNTGIFDRTYGYGHTNGSVTETTYDINGNPVTNTLDTALVHDVAGYNVDNLYGAPAFFSQVVGGTESQTLNGFAPNNAINGWGGSTTSTVNSCTTVSGNANVTVASGGFPGLEQGDLVTGTGIVAGSTVLSVVGNTLTVSNKANASGTVTLTFTRGGSVQATTTVIGALTNVGVTADGSFDRSWGNGDQVTAYNGKAGASSQSAKFSSNTSNYTTGSNTDSGATAPVYGSTGSRAADGSVPVGAGVLVTPAYDTSSIIDRSSGWGHTNGPGTTVPMNNATANYVWPPTGKVLHD